MHFFCVFSGYLHSVDKTVHVPNGRVCSKGNFESDHAALEFSYLYAFFSITSAEREIHREENYMFQIVSHNSLKVKKSTCFT